MQDNCFLYNKCNHKDCDKEFCLRRYKIEGLYKAALLSEAQQKDLTITVNDNDVDLQQFVQIQSIIQNIDTFVKEGKNLYLHSHICGNGKTTSAIKLIKAYIDKIWVKAEPTCRALFISVPRFLLAIKDRITNVNEYAEYILDNVQKADIVVWDDIAAKVGTDFELNHLLSIIDTRICLGKSNVFTSNLSKPEIYKALGDRLGSRICNLSIDIELNGMDKRYLAK